ncbi:hypothetical protein AMTR_s00165p00028990 [Amborella trichopoda]|uniref:Uncharacterized protein n=1 Tax=Amborella trichopoda TaxID=13333 RepID=W1PVY4_AMBTC|nr:hypothetical protein AMTR_s00165p00028990 [Amborella trichopoda]
MGESGAVPHVLIFPFPAQGHINSMLKLAELFVSLTNFHVTFLNSEHNHKRLGLRADSLLERVHFEAITDGLPECHPRSADRIMDLFDSLKARTKPIFREMLREKAKRGEPPVTCVIGDAILSFILEIGEEVGVPVIAFRTVSACSLWAYFSIPWLIDARVLPIPGWPTPITWRDTPTLVQVASTDNAMRNSPSSGPLLKRDNAGLLSLSHKHRVAVKGEILGSK